MRTATAFLGLLLLAGCSGHTSPRFQDGKATCRADGKVHVKARMRPVEVLCQQR